MIYLSKYHVESFRGITDLELEDLGDINLILGDNNCGKTSFLESLMLLRNINDFSNVIRVSRIRSSNYFYFNRLSSFNSFLYMFNPMFDKKTISIGGVLNDVPVSLKISGILQKVMVDRTEIQRNNKQVSLLDFDENENSDDNLILEDEITEFNGTIKNQYGNRTRTSKINLNEISNISGMRISRPYNIDFEYVSSIEHSSTMIFSSILKEPSFKELVLKVVQLFDPNIADLLYLKNEQTGRPIEYIYHKELGNMPLLSFGDGVKKVILLANSIAKAAGGILLIDEIETSINSKYYDDIFNFVVKACQEFNIQLFITTHSIEAVDGLLSTQRYDDYPANKDLIRVITFRKRNNRTFSRVLNGKQAYEDRKNYGLEVRIWIALFYVRGKLMPY